MSPKPLLATAVTLVASLVFASGALSAPTFRSASSVSPTTAVGSVSIKRPAGAAAGDVMVAGLVVRVPYSTRVTAPSGWTLVRREASAQGLSQLLYTHLVGAAETDVYRFSFSSVASATGVVADFAGVWTPWPTDAHSGAVAASSTLVRVPSLMTGMNGCLLVGLFGTTSTVPLTAPAGMASRVKAASGAAKPVSIALADKLLGAAGSTGPQTASATATRTILAGQTIALRPSPFGSPLPPPPAALAPSSVAAPAISGTAQAGQTLVATAGSWTGTAPISYAYAWSRCDAAGASCSAIAGAASASYLLAAADVGATVRVVVTASNDAGSASATSAATARVAAAPVVVPPADVAPSLVSAPTISGTVQSGQTLTATAGSWSGTAPIAYAYAWRRCDAAGASCVAVAGATGSSYALAAGDVGATLRVAVTASNVAGSATAVSAATAVVAAPSPPPPPPSGALVSDDFNSYASGSVITDSSSYLFASFPAGGTSGPSNPSSRWEADTGWLYADSGWGFSGRPMDWPDRWFFRLNTRNFGFGNGSVSWRYRSASFGQDGYAVDSADAVDVWLRYQTQYNLYIVQFDRTNNCVVAKRKVPGDGWGGSSSLIVNHGIYYTLKTDAAQPVFGAGLQCISWGGLGLPNLAHDASTVYSFKATATTLPSGNVQLQLWRNGTLVFSVTDANDGTNASGATFASDLAAGYYRTVPGWQSSWGKPITANGAVGFRADNIKIWLDDFVVQPS